MSLNCHCYTCNVKYPANAYIFSSNNEDEQNIIVQICKRIFEAIQHKHTSTEISYDGNIMLHKQIRNINEVENFINKEFSQLFENEILRKEIKKLPIGIWRIGFKWDEFDNDSLIKNILKISSEWYYNFIKYFQKIDQKRNIEAFNSFNPDLSNNEEELQQYLLDNLKNYLLGFEYLIDYSWNFYDDYKGNFIFASDSGIFIVVEIKCLNVKNGHNDLSKPRNVSPNNDGKDQSLEYKDKAAIEFSGKYITILRATLICDLDANSSDKVTFEFSDNDEIIGQHIKEVQNFSTRRYDEFNNEFNELDKYEIVDNKLDGFQTLSSHNNQDTTSMLQGIITKVAAAAAIGYMIYQTFSRRNHSN